MEDKRDAWDRASGLDRIYKSDRELAQNMAQIKQEQRHTAQRHEKIRRIEAIRMEEKRKNSLRARISRFLIGKNGLLRKDILAPLKRRK
ncbi:MAG: hypothetical protein AABW59_03470 [archaeon]